MKFLVSKTYGIVTRASVTRGDYAKAGFEYKNVSMGLRDVIRALEDFTELSAYPVRSPNDCAHVWATRYPETDPFNGSETSYSLHIKTNPRNLFRIYRLAGLIR